MPRKYFINPYNFIPLTPGGPVLPKNSEEVGHACFYPDRFTGVIQAKLTFITPAVIPRKPVKGTASGPGKIETYTYNNRLAIPGSTIRGAMLNVMRTINSSPIIFFEKDQVIIGRTQGNHRKGFIIENNGKIKIRETCDEILAVHEDRDGIKEGRLSLQEYCIPGITPVIYRGETEVLIPDFDPLKDSARQGESGVLYWNHPNWGPPGVRRFKKYLADLSKGSPKQERGRWVKFHSWSGQDGKNYFKDLHNSRRMVHRNAWHIVNLDKLVGDPFFLDESMIRIYQDSVHEMVSRVENLNDEAEQALSKQIKKLGNLKSGDFIYFELSPLSMGRHYRYLFKKGSVAEKIIKANRVLKDQDCVVQQLSGRQSDRDKPGLKGRLWVEMAIGPSIDDVQLDKRNLRILTSQPPKAHNFYLKGGDYNESNSMAKGRKFYWHDPRWKERFWDNEDRHCGDYAFDNPDPLNRDLWKQWSNAEVIMATEESPVTFDLAFRVVNFSLVELNLLITTLVGFSPSIIEGQNLGQTKYQNWCHKIGHARPFMGSAFIQVSKIQGITFDSITWEPKKEPLNLENIMDHLNLWQENEIKGPHIDALKRIMRYDGAYENIPQADLGYSRISYPLGQKEVNELTWNIEDETKRPKTFHWFGQPGKPPLPDALPMVNQMLAVYLPDSNSGRRGTPPGISATDLPKHDKKIGSLGEAFSHARESKEKSYPKGRKNG